MSPASPALYHRKLLDAFGGAWFDFEGLIRDIYTHVLRPGDTAMDVGVNRGDHFWQMLAAVGKEGFVLGVEAAPAMVESTIVLLKNLDMFAADNFDIRNVAVSDKEGRATFSFVAGAPGLSSLAKRDVAGAYETEEIEVDVTTLDKLLSGVVAPLNFVKIDIEGAEYHALLGGTRIFADRSPLVFEFDKDSPAYFSYDPGDLLGLFAKHGYEVRDFFGQSFVAPSQLMESGVWNYYAGPVGSFEALGVRDVVFRTLGAQRGDIPLP